MEAYGIYNLFKATPCILQNKIYHLPFGKCFIDVNIMLPMGQMGVYFRTHLPGNTLEQPPWSPFEMTCSALAVTRLQFHAN